MATHSDWQGLAAGIRPRTGLWINGRWEEAASGARFVKVNPATGAVLAEVARGDAADVDRAVAAARAPRRAVA